MQVQALHGCVAAHEPDEACSLQAKASACDQHQALEAQEARRAPGRDPAAAALGSMDWRVRMPPLASMRASPMRVQRNAHAAVVLLTAGLSANPAAHSLILALPALPCVACAEAQGHCRMRLMA